VRGENPFSAHHNLEGEATVGIVSKRRRQMLIGVVAPTVGLRALP
jgi:hypothetical protein